MHGDGEFEDVFAAFVGKIAGFGEQFAAHGVGAELKLSHCADSIMSQGWKPNLLGSAVDKCRVLSASLSSFVVYLVVDSEFVRG